MARFCLATGFTPKEFYELTFEEHKAIINELEERMS